MAETIDYQAMWNRMKMWAAKRHDYLEAQYKETNFSADAAELGAFRSCYQAMKDIEEQAINQLNASRAREPQRSAPNPMGRGR